MAQSHHFPRKLATSYAKPSTVFWAVSVPHTLVMFVHGFGGSSSGTWPMFPDLLPRTIDGAHADFVFYQYDGLRSQSNGSALDLFHFLDAFLKNPLKTVGASLGGHQRPANFTYQRVIIVGHSLGSVVIRRALLNAHRAAATDPATRVWLDRVRMILFAPAHRGAHAAVIAAQVIEDLPWYLGMFGRIAQYHSPLIAELTPGSPILKDLESDTVKALAATPGAPHLVAKQVLWAGKEKVVINADFGADPLAKQMNNRDHFSVCKPRDLEDPTLLVLIEEMTAS